MKKTAPVYIIYGDNEFAVSSAGRKLVDEIVPPDGQAFGLEIVEGNAENAEQALNAVRKCGDALRTAGFLGSGKVVWLRDANFLADTVVGRVDAVKERVRELARIIENDMPAGQILVVTATKADKRTTFYSSCVNRGADIQECSVPAKAFQAAAYARDFAVAALGRAGLKLSSDGLAAFLEKAGTDARQIANEVEKLALYAGASKSAGTADVNAIVSTSRETLSWDLADAVGERNLARALSVLRQLMFQRESPVGLVIGLERRMGDLLLLREALDRKWVLVRHQGGRDFVQWDVPADVDKAMAELGKEDPRKLHPFRAGKLLGQAQRFTAGDLSRCEQCAAEAHGELVSGGVPEQIVLELLIMRLLGSGRGRLGAGKPARAAARNG